MDTGMLMTMLSLVGVRLPILIALGVALVWVVDSPRGAVRTAALSGLGILAATCILGMVVSLLPVWWIQQNQYENLQSRSLWLGVAHFGLSLAEAFGLVLVVWAMTRALRQRGTAG
ncbi:hypothetical protein [Stenotrophomonas sp. Marseille-Q5258]|uniref:hypothetical protein n=1 Tax=Stenotrophomonas sp. Marseille-Q5258 TaxID=2972779 RepID=UPI0021C567F7|nr:hypothetical protein [Stenotrophomonas sp. Marseille-Q5258]